MRIPYLGKIRFFWCDSCHVPLIRKKCGSCEKVGRKISLTPPGDIRPALEGDRDLILSVINSQFGKISAQKFRRLIQNQIIFLNKVPYVDRMDEIIIQGEVVGVFRYNILKGAFELLPRVSLATDLWSTRSDRCVVVDIGARDAIKKGASVLSPGIISADLNISINDPVIVICENEVIAVGLAKMNGDQMGPPRRGVAVKTKYSKKSSIQPLKPSKMGWDRIIEANRQSMNSLEQEAIQFIQRKAEQYEKHVVAYSGGKDSLVTLDLVVQSNISFEIIFLDTGLEYPETLKNIQLIEQEYQKRVFIHKNESWDFWERFDQFGPPSRNSRWCCKSAKLFPANEILDYLFPNDKKVLSYIGRRRYESLGRSREPRISQNPWIPKQVTAAPINNWSAFEIFLYIHKHNLNQFLNPLYNNGFIRIGCWVCPASSLSDFEIMKKTHFSLIRKLTFKLSNIQEKHGLSNQYLSWGLWRWKYLPKKISNLLRSEGFSNTSYNPVVNQDKLKFRITNSPSLCVHGGYSTLLSANQMLDLSKIKDLLPIHGSVQFNEELDVISISGNKSKVINIFRDGSIIINHNKKEELIKQISSIIRTIYRKTYCDGCGICTYQCNKKALIIESGAIKVLENRCSHCLACNDFCSLLKYQSDSPFLIVS
ncbi:MAG: phosphoadenosine phosphosulfate reductase family protein [Candidatus Heimdallarchaeota archaeon]|nr:MAG: phosphoadenosine phosphosulfate reductase family protein [Candidatus Heimdallarchaeota archaeon]